MQKILLFIVGVCTSLFFLSCSKSEATKTTTELLTSGSWVLQTKQTQIGTSGWVDATASVTACKKDDVHGFSNPNGYSVREGATKCNVADPDIVASGTWEFLSGETKLKTTAGASIKTYDIYLITENVLTIDEVDSSGIVVIYTRYTFTH